MNRLILGDIRRQVLPPVNLIVTDPPYRVISGGNAADGRPTGILKSNDSRIFQHNDIAFADYLPQLYLALRDPGHLYMMVNFFNLEAALAATRQAGFDIHNLLVWQKNTVTPNRWYMKNCEYVIFARKGKAMTINDCGSKTVHSFTNTIDRDHPVEKPVDLMRLYIENSSKPGDLVLDPFMGSGTTGVAAKVTGRRFLGIEIDPVYYAAACRRMSVMP
jgi:site-specific DNA-methyltransferase (adenine-specific)